MRLGKHLTDEQFELLVQEMEYHRMINDQVTSIENNKTEDYDNKQNSRNQTVQALERP